MPNRLVDENSPYLLQHAHNPVEWYPWGSEALEKARREDKPIFLSIGYAACHWCHVMAHESFEDPKIAGIMNESFVNIKVDREERPDLDSIYMNAVVAMTGQGGWPMSVFLTPDGQPFYGGTYFPPVRRYNMPSFEEVLLSVQRAWLQDRQHILQSSQRITEYIQAAPADAEAGSAGVPLQPETLEKASFALAQSYDWKYGGWGAAPKFPQSMAVEFLLRRASVGDALARDIAVHALRAMAKGGMYDVVGGGFARYSTDNFWLVPHFEKMLYDNALLALAYLHAYLLTGSMEFRRVCVETLEFITREMTHRTGGFYSSLDADFEGEEGKFYLWTLEEVHQALNNPEDIAFLSAAYHLTVDGNFEGSNILQRALDDEQLAERFSQPVETVVERLMRLHQRLLKVRSRRVRPATDDKVLVSWNSLALIAFAEAARYLQRPDFLMTAQRNAAFLLDKLYTGERLLRSWRDGQGRHNAFLEDYAGLILALLALYQSDHDNGWYSAAASLAEEMIAHFADPTGGFYDTRDDHDRLITRPKDLQDNATPSGNALAAGALLRLAAYTGEGRCRELAEASLSAIQSAAERYPTSFGLWLCEIEFALSDLRQVAILGSPAANTASVASEVSDTSVDKTSSLLKALWAAYRPNLILALASLPLPQDAPPLLQERGYVDGQPAAYVCQDFVCLRPVTTPEELTLLLGNTG